MTKLGVKIQVPIKILVDNMSKINLAKNNVSHGRSKHIETRFHYIREKVNKGRLVIRYYPTKNQVVDILTKVVKGEQFYKLKINMGIMAFNSEVGKTYGSLASESLMAFKSSAYEGIKVWNNLASEVTNSEGVMGWKNLSSEVLISSEPSTSKGVRSGNYF